MRWNSKTMNNIKNKLKWIKFNLCPVFFFLFVSFEICSVERKRMFIFPKLLQCQHILKKLCSDIFFFIPPFLLHCTLPRGKVHITRGTSRVNRRAYSIVAPNIFWRVIKMMSFDLIHLGLPLTNIASLPALNFLLSFRVKHKNKTQINIRLAVYREKI